MDWLILLLAILFNGLEAAIEAIFNQLDNIKPNRVHRFIEKLHVVVVIVVFALWVLSIDFIPNETPWWKLFLGFWFIRFAIYDFIWNLTSILSGNKDVELWGYGTTKWYDRIMTKLVSWGWFVKCLFGLVGIFFLLG